MYSEENDEIDFIDIYKQELQEIDNKIKKSLNKKNIVKFDLLKRRHNVLHTIKELESEKIYM